MKCTRTFSSRRSTPATTYPTACPPACINAPLPPYTHAQPPTITINEQRFCFPYFRFLSRPISHIPPSAAGLQSLILSRFKHIGLGHDKSIDVKQLIAKHPKCAQLVLRVSCAYFSLCALFLCRLVSHNKRDTLRMYANDLLWMFTRPLDSVPEYPVRPSPIKCVLVANCSTINLLTTSLLPVQC